MSTKILKLSTPDTAVRELPMSACADFHQLYSIAPVECKLALALIVSAMSA